MLSTKERSIPMELKPTYAYECAKEFTIVALENSMISASSDPKKSAQNVTDFFQTAYVSLIGDESAQNLNE